jgi:lysophospholipase L1-like esterase
MTQSVLCFGDSNTWGYNPKDGSRYPAHIRWTGVLQQKLGQGFRVIEEGLNGRTTTINEEERPMRSAADILPVLIESHRPLDFVVLMLGTNDLKTHFDRSSEQIANDLSRLCAIIKQHPMFMDHPPKLILAEPTGADLSSKALPEWFQHTEAKWKGLIDLMPEIAQEHQALYVATHKFIELNFVDSLHWSPEQHTLFAQEVFAQVIASI